MLVDTAQRGVVVHCAPTEATETARQCLRAMEAGGDCSSGGAGGGGGAGDPEERAHPAYILYIFFRPSPKLMREVGLLSLDI